MASTGFQRYGVHAIYMSEYGCDDVSLFMTSIMQKLFYFQLQLALKVYFILQIHLCVHLLGRASQVAISKLLIKNTDYLNIITHFCLVLVIFSEVSLPYIYHSR